MAHLVGDYLFQSHWMAMEKIYRWWPAILHGVTYTIAYLFVTQSIPALLIICISHIVIDRYRLARYVVWLKNQMTPMEWVYRTDKNDEIFGERQWNYRYEAVDRVMARPVHVNMSVAPSWAKRYRADEYRWANSCATGYPAQVPDYLAVWLLIIADNTLHLLINTLAIVIFGT